MAILPEYPAPPGNKNMVVATITGPNPYAPVVVATPPTGGQTINASDLGLVDIETAWGSMSDNGQFCVRVLPTSNPARGVPSIKLMWFTAATGAEAGAVDLSGRTIRLTVIGH